MNGDTKQALRIAFQTNPCGFEAQIEVNDPGADYAFQTNPCGFEASRFDDVGEEITGFRRTLVGLKQIQRTA